MAATINFVIETGKLDNKISSVNKVQVGDEVDNEAKSENKRNDQKNNHLKAKKEQNILNNSPSSKQHYLVDIAIALTVNNRNSTFIDRQLTHLKFPLTIN